MHFIGIFMPAQQAAVISGMQPLIMALMLLARVANHLFARRALKQRLKKLDVV
ncbi:MAG TPA: hypothetical protein VMV33_15070 [Rhodocyclaceae bacterium]|nr:hypothetical protein [Rhodocyclaceae bacterium]